MTALESDICFMRSKPRRIRSAWGAAFSRFRLSPVTTLDAPKATRRPPARSMP
jgi:hypothetical protein